MGGTGWDYEVPYQADIGAALEALRQDVFARGDYEKVWDQFEGHREALAAELTEMAEMMGVALEPAWVTRLAGGDQPESIDEAIAWSADSGTHSILDIVGGVGDTPDFGVITPLPPSEVEALFGTTQPATATVRGRLGDVDALVHDRWQGFYVVGYAGDEPESIFFVGASGD